MKGQALSLSDILFGLIMLILLVGFYVLVNLGVFNIQVVIQSNEVDRHAINMAQAIMSSNYIAYNDGSTIHRAVFDENKLNQQMTSSLLTTTDFENTIGYPNSFAIITVQDLQTGQQWQAYSGDWLGSATAPATSLIDVLSCVNNNYENALFSFFSNPLGAFGNFFNQWNLVACIGNKVSADGSSVRYFPVAVLIPNGQVHSGILSVNLEEFSGGV